MISTYSKPFFHYLEFCTMSMSGNRFQMLHKFRIRNKWYRKTIFLWIECYSLKIDLFLIFSSKETKI